MRHSQPAIATGLLFIVVGPIALLVLAVGVVASFVVALFLRAVPLERHPSAEEQSARLARLREDFPVEYTADDYAAMRLLHAVVASFFWLMNLIFPLPSARDRSSAPRESHCDSIAPRGD